MPGAEGACLSQTLGRQLCTRLAAPLRSSHHADMNNHSADNRTPNGPQRLTTALLELLLLVVATAVFMFGPAAVRLIAHVIE